MQAGSAPLKIPLPWASGANSAYIRAIPTPSQIGISNGAASWNDGFPPLNLTALSAGGIPPFGQDMNGSLNQISAGLQWLQAGGPLVFDQTFAISIGGYPKGAIVASTTFPARWISTVDNNVSNPDAGGAGWTYLSVLHGVQWFTSSQSWTLPASQIYVKVWGGGAGGGGCVGNNFGTGGGGGYSEGLITGLTPGASIAITVGGGGTGGSSGGGNGGVGGTSSFGSYITCTGGAGGAGDGDAGGAGGAGSGGAINFVGVGGGYGVTAAGAVIFGGFGGSTFCGPFINPGTNANAGGGLYPGVGGNGAGSNNTSYAGGPGAAGLIITSW